MGIWSIEGFANDEALDWLQRIDPRAGAEPVVRTLRNVIGSSDPHLSAGQAEIALAAAELLAALHGHPPAHLPEPARRWVAAQGTRELTAVDVDALVAATRALDLVVTTSQLSEVWSQRADEQAWRTALDDLRMRLALAGGMPLGGDGV